MTTTTSEPVKPPRVPLWIVLVIGAGAILAVPLLLRIFLLELFHIPAESMSPTLLKGDLMIVFKLASKPRRGQVVVFGYPLDPEIKYVKRVVGLAGDTVEFRAGRLLVNGVAADSGATAEACEPASGDGSRTAVEQLDGRAYRIKVGASGDLSDVVPTKIPPGHIFVVGDDRNNSIDSRVWGNVPEKLIVGPAIFILWSISEAGPRWNRIGTAVH